jgi:hypothetical protein
MSAIVLRPIITIAVVVAMVRGTRLRVGDVLTEKDDGV